MNRTIRLFASTLVIGSLLLYSQCADDDSGGGPTAQQTATDFLTDGPWNVVTQASTDTNTPAVFPAGFSLTFSTNGTFTAANTTPDGFAGPIFSNSTWEWEDESTTTNLLIGGEAVTVTVTDTQLNMQFVIDDATPVGTNRTSSVNATWSLILGQQ